MNNKGGNMYFFLNRFQKLKGEKATYCKSIYEKLTDENKTRLIKKGNVTANVMGTIYAVLLALAIASAVVSFLCKFWWAGVFFCTFGVLVAYLTYSGFSWRKREGFEYAKIFGEDVIYMLGQQERDKLKSVVTVDTVLEKVATEQKVASKSSKKKTEEFVEMPIDTESIEIKENEEKLDKPTQKTTKPAKKNAKASTKSAKAKTTSTKELEAEVEPKVTQEEKVEKKAQKTAKTSSSAKTPKTTKSSKVASTKAKSVKATTSTKAKSSSSAKAKTSAKKSAKKTK